jgi:hypothetical protein
MRTALHHCCHIVSGWPAPRDKTWDHVCTVGLLLSSISVACAAAPDDGWMDG